MNTTEKTLGKTTKFNGLLIVTVIASWFNYIVLLKIAPIFKKERRSVAFERSFGYDGFAVTQDIGFIHEVSRQQDDFVLFFALQ